MELKSQNKLFNHFFIIMSRQSNAEKKFGKLDPIYHNRLAVQKIDILSSFQLISS